jgi:hypothetical protein
MKTITIPAQEVSGQTKPERSQLPTGSTTSNAETAQENGVEPRPQAQVFGLAPAAYTVGGVVSQD